MRDPELVVCFSASGRLEERHGGGEGEDVECKIEEITSACGF